MEPSTSSTPPLRPLFSLLEGLLLTLVIVVTAALSLYWAAVQSGHAIDLAPHSTCPVVPGPYVVVCTGPALTVLMEDPSLSTNAEDLVLITASLAYAKTLGSNTVCLTWTKRFPVPAGTPFGAYGIADMECYTTAVVPTPAAPTLPPVPGIGG